jgi:Cytochrome D1 heme domain
MGMRRTYKFLWISAYALEIVKTLRPVPGKTSAHVEFTRDGIYALVSIWEIDGAVVVYDANMPEEVKRPSMNKPVGKYNVYNKIYHLLLLQIFQHGMALPIGVFPSQKVVETS